jgi:hypothetical protein
LVSIDHSPILNAYIPVKPLIVAHKLSKEYTKDKTLKSLNQLEGIDPIDTNGIPPYLLETSTNLLKFGGEFYVASDVFKEDN